MKGLKYQLKNIRRDKMCILTFLLPIIAGIAIHLLSGVNLKTVSETAFGVLKNDLSKETVLWLQASGNLTQYETPEELYGAINDPSTQIIGVLKTADGIQTLLSGDELTINKVIADTLPQVYAGRRESTPYRKTIIPVPETTDGLTSLLIVITLVTAMFMGSTFNAMNIISEKEDGVALINRILPMTAKSYIIQKITLGFMGSAASTLITALICMQIKPSWLLPFLLLITLSAYISALTGLFIGHFSEDLMTGIVYIKILMILFLAPPILFYLTLTPQTPLFNLSYLLPSSATFYALMDPLNNRFDHLALNLFILFSHAVLWSMAYILFKTKSPRQRPATAP